MSPIEDIVSEDKKEVEYIVSEDKKEIDDSV